MKSVLKFLILVMTIYVNCSAMNLHIIDQSNYRTSDDEIGEARATFDALHSSVPQGMRDALFNGLVNDLGQGKATLVIVGFEGKYFANVFYAYDQDRDMIRLRLVGYDAQQERALIKDAMNLVIEHVKGLSQGIGAFCCMHKIITQGYVWLVQELGFVVDASLFGNEADIKPETHDWYRLAWN